MRTFLVLVTIALACLIGAAVILRKRHIRRGETARRDARRARRLARQQDWDAIRHASESEDDEPR
ncbi:hypothetical protein [Sphingomonas baiyangensis]|uniref:Uncharacterized protein n=1 Tax=Sphingomonas baiyangensis TaxID=2572576 RepID=A0A4U1L3E1_9SPHN|nr:hypothetical protein [Sphingomonas baiyangensis]TKD50994.1 hypothetical protein FBR43_09650 [Sphingomonas baiyangensis]